MLPDDAQSRSGGQDPHELNDKVEELVAQILDAIDPSAELLTVRVRHPEIFSRVQSIYHRLVREDLVQQAASSAGKSGELEGYRLLRILGRGGMGIVHLAEQIEPKRLVAIKLLRPELLDVESSRTRFRHEITAVARLQHPGIAQVFEAREDAEIPFFVMEYIEGKSMARVIKDLGDQGPTNLTARAFLHQLEEPGSTTGTSRLDPNQSWEKLGVRLGQELCDALQHAHERGVLHRDVKPSNILLTRDGRARLVDFGLARLEGETRLTRSEAELGSLPFIPPENLRGSVLPSEQRDVYGLGVTLYEFLSFKNPFLGAEASETRRRILRGQAPSLRHWNPSLSWELETVIQKAMSPEPELRYASARAFGEDLARVSRREAILAKRPGAALRTRRWLQRHPSLAGMTAVALVLLVAASLVFAFRENQAKRESQRLTNQAQESSYVASIQAAGLGLDRGDSLDETRRLLASCPERLRGFEWRYLAERLDSSQRRVRVPQGRVLDIVWAEHGRSYAVLTRASEILIYDSESEQPRLRWKVEGMVLESIAWRPGHDQVIYGLEDGSIQLRSTIGEQAAQVVCDHVGGGSQPSTMVCSTDGKSLFIGYENGRVLQIDVDGQQIVKRLQEHGGHVSSLALSSNGRTLAVGTLAGRSGSPAMALVFGLLDGSVRRYDQARSFSAHVAVDASGEFVFLASVVGLEIIDLAQDKRRFVSRRGCIHPSLSTDGRRLACVLGKRQLAVYAVDLSRNSRGRPARIQPMARLLGHQRQIFDLACEPGTHRFWSGGDDPNLRCWNAHEGNPNYTLAGPRQRVTVMQNLPGNRILTGDTKGYLRIHDRGGSKEWARISESEILDLRIWTEGRILVVHADGTVASLDSTTGVLRARRHVRGATCITPVEGGYALGTKAGSIVLHAERSNQDENLDAGTDKAIVALDRHAETQSLLVAVADGSLLCIDLKTRRQRWECKAHEGWIADMKIDPRGRYVVSIGQDKSARIWNLWTGHRLQSLEGMDRAPLALAISPDGSRLAVSSGYAREVRICDPLRGSLLTTLLTPRVPFALTFSETILAAAGMADASFGGGAHMGQIECWRGSARSLPRDHKTPASLDKITPPPARSR